VTGSVKRRLVLGTAIAGVSALLLSSCAEYRVERQGKDFGQALCDVKNADNKEDVQKALQDAKEQLDDAARIAGRPVGEDVKDVNENLDDLAGHVVDNQPNLVQQDIAAIRRNVEAAVSGANGAAQRFYEGTVEGLGRCSD
jgi:hypothetical protein